MNESERDIGQEILGAVLEIKAGGGHRLTVSTPFICPECGQETVDSETEVTYEERARQ